MLHNLKRHVFVVLNVNQPMVIPSNTTLFYSERVSADINIAEEVSSSSNMNRLDSADTTWLTSDFLKNETFKNWRYENLCMRSETFIFDSPMTQQLNQYRENVSRRIYSTFSNEFTTCGLKHKFKL